ncbi:LysR family transcriptional regulator [Serratia plymuthica]|uniref:LysR family transcriptional regulator n=1 Tax=Serratia plymuthica TaxID=82996 RepID=UPI002DBE7542|nr:LysR family transcriptional regulator [Serratia plymuthica]MEB6540915.1 LysR family transcriptional regulator [Serratia plymuthica]
MSKIDFNEVDLNLLKVFEALHEEGGAGRAAIRLGLTQSAVSAALSRLRILYSDHLFERTGRGLRPTSKAEELRPLIAEALDKCWQSIAQTTSSTEGYGNRVLTLGLSDDYEIAIGAALIEHIRNRAPGLRLILRQTHSLIAGEALMVRNIDLSLTAGGVTSRTLGRQALGTGGYACVLDPRHAPVGELDLNEYLRREHILVSFGGFVGIVDEVLKGLGRKRQVRASTTHFAVLPHLLLGNDCVATLPKHAAQILAQSSPLCCVDCPVNLPSYSIELGWRSDSLRDPAIQHLKILLVEICQMLLGTPIAATTTGQDGDNLDIENLQE